MKRVSRFEAASRSTAELHGLLAEAFKAFANAPRSSQERRDALASMRNSEDDMAARARSLTGHESGHTAGLRNASIDDNAMILLG